MSVIFPTFPFFAPSRACVLPGDKRHFGKQKNEKGAGRKITDITDTTDRRQLNDVSRHQATIRSQWRALTVCIVQYANENSPVLGSLRHV